MIVHATLGERDRTQEMASEVVACSRTMRRFGKSAARRRRWVRKCFSELRMEMFWREYQLLCSTLASQQGSVAGGGVGREKADLSMITWHLAVKIQDHPLLLHRLEYRIVHRVILDAGATIRRNSPRIALYPCAPVSCFLVQACNRPRIPALEAFRISSGVTSGCK